MSNKSIFFLCLIILFSCSSQKEDKIKKKNAKAEYIYRHNDNSFAPIVIPTRKDIENYPWEEGKVGNLSKISKEFFRCKGSLLNPDKYDETDPDDIKSYKDCEGSSKHSLPLMDNKEQIYPVMIDILNYIQRMTKKRVVVTCGHRCPTHNKYADNSKLNRTSKHMIGAEVDFYVQGYEERTLEIVELIFQFYKDKKQYKNNPEFINFTNYENETDVSTLPWMNKEVFVKLYQKEEGRDFDNRHPYPYISIQVRYDRDKSERVVYSWGKANKGYSR